MTDFPIKNCLNCHSPKLYFNRIEIEIKDGFLASLVFPHKYKKLDKFTCNDCGLVMFFDPKLTGSEN